MSETTGAVRPRTKTRRVGRPPLPEPERRSVVVRIRLTEDEYDLLTAVAVQNDMSVSGLMRACVGLLNRDSLFVKTLLQTLAMRKKSLHQPL